MLGVTSYQEALRALGAELESTPDGPLRIVELPGHACLVIEHPGATEEISAARLEQIALRSHARRGAHTVSGYLSDVLRSVGLALDELSALQVDVHLRRDSLRVTYCGRDHQTRELTYHGDELEALRQAAAARRHGAPLKRVLILHADADAAVTVRGLRELLVAEFAVQALPTVYARSVGEAGETPEVVLAHAGGDPPAVLQALHALRRA